MFIDELKDPRPRKFGVRLNAGYTILSESDDSIELPITSKNLATLTGESIYDIPDSNSLTEQINTIKTPGITYKTQSPQLISQSTDRKVYDISEKDYNFAHMNRMIHKPKPHLTPASGPKHNLGHNATHIHHDIRIGRQNTYRQKFLKPSRKK